MIERLNQEKKNPGYKFAAFLYSMLEPTEEDPHKINIPIKELYSDDSCEVIKFIQQAEEDYGTVELVSSKIS